MNPWRSGVLAAGLAVAATAAEPAREDPAPAGLEQAANELRALTRPAADAPAAPRVAPVATPVPATPAAARPGPALNRRQLETLRRQQEEKENWLVRAMAPPEASDVPAATLDDLIAQARNVSTTPLPAPAADVRGRPDVVNPLDAFLGEWMTPADHALLVTPPASAATPVGPTPAPVVTVPPDGRAAANPFLPAVGTAENPSIRTPMPAPPVPTFAAPPPVPDAGAPAWTPPADFAPPPDRTQWVPPGSEENRYFPQLKRF